MWKKIQYLISLIADLLQIVNFFGATPATVATVVCAAIGWMSNISAYYLAVGSIVVFASALYLSREFIVRVGTIPLNDGACIAYDELRGTLWGAAAERLRVDSTPDGIVDYIATGITLEIPVFGKFPPSTRLERISDRFIRSGSIEGGGQLLQLRDQHRSQIVDLTLRKRDLRKAIQHMRESGKEFAK